MSNKQQKQLTLKERAEWVVACYWQDCYCDGNSSRDWVEFFVEGCKGTKDYTIEELKEELEELLGNYDEKTGKRIPDNRTLEELVVEGEKEWRI